MEIALNDLSNVLKTPKISIKKFEINAYERGLKNNLNPQLSAIDKSLKTLEQLSVENFNLYNVSCGYARSILPLLKSGKLKTIHISSKCSSANCCLDDIIEMEQWKGLKSAYFLGGCKVSASIEKFFNLDDIFILVKSLSVSDTIKIRDELLPSPTFHFAMFRGDIPNSVEIAKVFNPEYSGGVEGTFEFKANESNYVIKICPDSLQIDKKR